MIHGNKIENFEVRVSKVSQCNNKYIGFSGPLIKNGLISSRFIGFVSGKVNVPVQLCPGQIWKVTGYLERKENEKLGTIIQERCYISATELDCVLPTEGDAFIRLITQDKDFKGIGPRKARRLWTAFNSQVYAIIKSRDKTAIIDATGFTESACEILFLGMEKYENLRYNKWLCKIGVPVDVTIKIIKYHKYSTIDLITENPFRLMDFGLSFSDVSFIARKHFDCEADDHRRLTAAIDESLKRIINQGHTYGKESHVKNHLYDVLKDFKLVEKALKTSKPVTKVIISPKLKYWHPTSQIVQEYTVAKRLLALAAIRNKSSQAVKACEFSTSNLPFDLSNKQKEAAIQALEYGAYAITGGAGTGKTTLLKVILEAHHALGYQINSVALAGRAGMRMQEATGFVAGTVAKFLKEDFIHGPQKKLLVIDEASMIDIGTMYKIIIHISPDTKLLFVGDANQLPPIQSGLVFHDIIKSQKIPMTRLDVIQRQDESTGIPAYSNQVINGMIPSELSHKNITFHDTPIEQVESVAAELFSIEEDVQIVGMSKRGYRQKYAGIEQINRLCRNYVNPNGKRFEFDANGKFEYLDIRENDPVIFTKNNYDAGVFNGTLGRVASVKQQSNYFGMVETDTGENIELTESLLDSIQLGYAMTVHKAQGSQFKRIVIILSNPPMLNRNWLYTAITRAESHVDIIGPKQWLIDAINRPGDTDKRRSFLDQLLIHKSFLDVA